MNRIRLLNIDIDNVSMEEAVERVDQLIQEKKPSIVITPNVDHVVKVENDKEFKAVYTNADLILADGMPLIWISKLKGNPLKEKVSGSDLFPRICELASRKKYKVFLLGAAEGVAEVASNKLKEKYKGLEIAGYYSPPFGFENDEEEINKIIFKVKHSSADILAVGLGAPKQEKFIYKYKEQLNIPVSLAIGASIDFEADNIRRAPKWMQNSGLEWLHRLIKEPKRMFKRYLVDDIKIVKLYFKYK